MSERLERIVQEQADAKPRRKTAPEPVIRDEEVFPGGPPQSMVDSWKRQYGEIYMTPFQDEMYVWRTMERFEYKMIAAQPNTDPLMREELICETCVLWPQSFDYEKQAQTKAGSISVLSEQIMELSNFTRSVFPQRL